MKQRVFYVPNEVGEFRQVGLRRPLTNLLHAGLIDDLAVYSLKSRVCDGNDPEGARLGLIKAVREFQPTIVLMQHLSSTGIRNEHFRKMRNVANFKLIYHEGDPYKLPMHPLPPEARVAGKFADEVLTVGSKAFRRNFVRMGAKSVRWVPSAYDADRFEIGDVDASVDRDFDVVVVANRNRPRFRGHPNWRDRIRFVEKLHQRLGTRVGIFGSGWEGPQTLGQVSFDNQHLAVRRGWISANWDHYAREASYFSNRLPISLAAGTIHATTWHPGYDKIFPKEPPFLLTAKTVTNLVDDIEKMLDSTTVEQRVQQSLLGQQYARNHFRQDDWLVRYLNYGGANIDARKASESWDLSVDYIHDM